MNCSWSYYKKCTVANLGNEPLLFFKYVREHYIEEILGLHLTKYFFDPELCFQNFLTGIEYKKKKKIMIITRSPLRISLGGGGTDLPSYYQKHEGFLLASTFNKYTYITLHKTFEEELILKYSRLERLQKMSK